MSNSAFLRIFGYREKTEILGKNAADHFPQKMLKSLQMSKRLSMKQRGETEEFIAQHKEGTNFPVECSSKCYRLSEIRRQNGFIY